MKIRAVLYYNSSDLIRKFSGYSTGVTKERLKISLHITGYRKLKAKKMVREEFL